ncbi:MAG TPA: STAS/SEC14 domain-containing protein [Vicinamibacteria bacterium]|nr:STAS/SEC14 domain-containing protein [Vicinamibacteria bacterium]
MTIEFTSVPNADAKEPKDLFVALQVIGRLEKSDFDVLGPRLNVLLEQHGKLKLLVELVAFEGWTAGAAWEDIKLALRHFRDIERIAVVGERRWEKGIAVLAKPFTAAELRYFDVQERESAESWVKEGGSGDGI